MTIHSAKGLEAKNIVVVLESNKIDEVFKNKLFVAITRGIENVYINCSSQLVNEYIKRLLM